MPVVAPNLIASAVYGALTVLLVLVSERLGLGAAGYSYLLAAAGAGDVLGAALLIAPVERRRRSLAGAVPALSPPTCNFHQ
jgi:hypothetical protein